MRYTRCMIQPFAERTHEKMRDVLMDPNADGPQVHYYMIRGGINKKNITIWESGTIGGEYIKAYGHYHVGHLDETYHVLHGEGILLLQIRKKDSQGEPILDEIEKFYAVKMNAGDKVFISSGIGHLMINIGNTWLVTSDDSPVNFTEADPISLPGHADYESVKKMKGFAYYVVQGPSFERNPTYKVAPEPQLMTALEYQSISG